MTDVLDYSAASVATALVLGRSMDVVVSFLTGPLLQHYNPSRGKHDGLLSWAMLLTVLYVITLGLLFCDTRSLGAVGVWASGFLYGLFSGVSDMIQGVFYSMMGVMAGCNQTVRNNLSIASSRGNKIGLLIMSMTALPLITYFSQFFTVANYTVVAVIYGLIMVVGMGLFARCYATEERFCVLHRRESESGFLDTCKALIQNRYLRAILFSDLFYYTGMMTVTGLGIYYFRLMGEFGPTYTLINSIINAAATIGVFVFPMLGIRMGKKMSKTLWLILFGLLMIIFSFVGERSVWIFCVFKIITQSTMMLWNFYVGPYMLDAAEAYLYETGVDTRVSAPGTVQIASDIGNILGGAIAGYGIAIIGYDAIDLETLANVTPEFMRSFLCLFGIGGILLLVAAFVWVKFYRITDEQAEFYAKENAKLDALRAKEAHEE